MLLRVVLTPIVRFIGLVQLHRVGSEGWDVRSVRVDLHDMPSEDAEDDAVVGSGTDPAQRADGALRNCVWQGAQDFIVGET